MKTAWRIAISAAIVFALLGAVPANVQAEPLIDADFSKGDFKKLGWEAKGAWRVFTYSGEGASNPGPVARFGANAPDGTLTKTFREVKNPRQMTLSLDYGWGWGSTDQGSDSVSFMLLDPKGDGYSFLFHRTKARWAVQSGRVVKGIAAERIWAQRDIDATRPSVREGGGLMRVTITRDAGGLWSVMSRDWNKGHGGAMYFTDAATSSFSQLVLTGTKNVDEQVFNKFVLTAPGVTATTAIPASDFLNSIGIVTTFPDRGQPLEKTVEMVKYGGFRWIRGGIEGLTEKGPTTIQTYLDLHKQTGARFSWGLVSGGSDLKKLIETARPLAAADALLAFEGNNEPNNWGVTYQGEKGGGKAPSWMAVAKLQRDLYAAVKSDATLKKYPVWSLSENGAQVDNVGLQFLTIPPKAGTLLPDGTKFADFANVHNYTYHPGSPGLADNKTWNAADPTSACKVDGLSGNYSTTWAKQFRGYSEHDLLSLPRVTTETGTTIGGAVTEEIQALNLLSTYLDQFKRGWKHTAVYLLRDRTDEAGNQSFGFFTKDYAPRKAAVYLHNLTTILADKGAAVTPGQLKYSIPDQTATMHDMLLQKSDGSLWLVVWNERIKGADDVAIHLGLEYSGVRVYNPTVGTEPAQKHDKADVLKLSLSDHPFIIEIPKP